MSNGLFNLFCLYVYTFKFELVIIYIMLNINYYSSGIIKSLMHSSTSNTQRTTDGSTD